ncbi:PIG-L deacetylase family protein [Thalassospira lucentensis]|uniref:PIG-L deacetylase family protein n=1 Tax=Thalassospira lucentensis TaxID=168935 RepID=UPI003D2F3B5E
MLRKIKNLITRFEALIWAKRRYKFLIGNLTDVEDLTKARDLISSLAYTSYICPLPATIPKNRKILVIAPHPDDEIIGPGGFLLMAGKQHCEISIFYLSSGREDQFETRETESRALCQEVGWSPFFGRNTAGKHPWKANSLIDIINELRPDILMLPFVLDDNSDHRHANELFHDAWKVTRTVLKESEVYAYQVYSAIIPNVVADISPVIRDKANYIRFHKSQMKTRDWVHFTLGLNAWTSRWISTNGDEAWAEGFMVMPCNEYINLISHYCGKDST